MCRASSYLTHERVAFARRITPTESRAALHIKRIDGVGAFTARMRQLALSLASAVAIFSSQPDAPNVFAQGLNKWSIVAGVTYADHPSVPFVVGH